MNNPDWNNMLKHIELCGRVCYKSEDKITDISAVTFIKKVLARKHEAVVEHASFSVRYIVDRGFTHELVRMRLASYCQESTRYCNYGDQDIQFIAPPWIPKWYINSGTWEVERYNSAVDSFLCLEDIPAEYLWLSNCIHSEQTYKALLNKGWSPQQARTVLNNSTKTEIIMTANIREWRHVLRLRAEPVAHPQMYEIIRPLLKTLKQQCPVLFEDIPDYTDSEEKVS